MCNEIEQTMIARCGGTVTDPDENPVRVTIYPVGRPDEVMVGSYDRRKLVRAGIKIDLYEEFYVEHWESPGGPIRSEIRPEILRELTDNEVKEIAEEVERQIAVICPDYIDENSPRFCALVEECYESGLYEQTGEILAAARIYYKRDIADMKRNRFSIDDRGNIAQFYDGDEIAATLDREANVDGKSDVTTWDGSGDVEEWAGLIGYGDEIRSAIRIGDKA